MKKFVIKTTPTFERRAKRLLTDEALEKLLDYLECYPMEGDIIPGTGGVRKLRWKSGKDNKGKRGGVRVLYHYSKDVLLVLLITLYSKSEQEDITHAERNELKRLIPELVALYTQDL